MASCCALSQDDAGHSKRALFLVLSLSYLGIVFEIHRRYDQAGSQCVLPAKLVLRDGTATKFCDLQAGSLAVFELLCLFVNESKDHETTMLSKDNSSSN